MGCYGHPLFSYPDLSNPPSGEGKGLVYILNDFLNVRCGSFDSGTLVRFTPCDLSCDGMYVMLIPDLMTVPGYTSWQTYSYL